MIKIYGIRQSRAARCYWAAEELGVAYESVPVSFVGETRKPEFLAINPNGHIPVLVDGDLTLFESMAINLYLAKKHGRSGFYPEGLADEARAIQWSFWAMTEIEPPLLQLLMHGVILPAEQRDPKQVEAAAAKLGPPLQVLDQALAGRQNLLGDTFTIADLNVAAVLSWAILAKHDLSATPNVERWLREACSRPSYAKAVGR